MPRRWPCTVCGALTPDRLCPAHADHRARQRKERDARPDQVARREADPWTRTRKSAWWRRTRLRILARDDYRCRACGCEHTRENPLSVDHIIPRAHGGSDDDANLQTLCRSCNASKGAR